MYHAAFGILSRAELRFGLSSPTAHLCLWSCLWCFSTHDTREQEWRSAIATPPFLLPRPDQARQKSPAGQNFWYDSTSGGALSKLSMHIYPRAHPSSRLPSDAQQCFCWRSRVSAIVESSVRCRAANFNRSMTCGFPVTNSLNMVGKWADAS